MLPTISEFTRNSFYGNPNKQATTFRGKVFTTIEIKLKGDKARNRIDSENGIRNRRNRSRNKNYRKANSNKTGSMKGIDVRSKLHYGHR